MSAVAAQPWPERPEQAELSRPHEMRRGQPCHVYRKVVDGEGDWVCTICFPERFEAGARPSEEENAGLGDELGDAIPVGARPLLHPGTQ